MYRFQSLVSQEFEYARNLVLKVVRCNAITVVAVGVREKGHFKSKQGLVYQLLCILYHDL